MQTWMKAAVVVETALIAFLLSLWLAKVALRGLFHMMPGMRSRVPTVTPAMDKTQTEIRSAQAGHRRAGTRVQQA